MDLRELMAAIGALPVPPPVSEESLPASLRLPLRPLFENLEAWREFALQVQTLGLEGDSGENLTERVEQLENMLRNVRGYGGAEVRTGPAGIAIGVSPAKPPLESLPEEPALFRVTVTVDDGEAGSAAADCSWTYTVAGIEGDELGTGITPEKPRYAKCAYAEPDDASPGLAWWHTDGTIKLYEALEEVPSTNVVTPITSTRYDTATHTFQYKKTSLLVLETGDEDAAWTDITGLTECDDT